MKRAYCALICLALAWRGLDLQAATLFMEDFEDGDVADWTVNSGNYVRAVTNDTSADGTRSFVLIGGSLNHTDGISHSLAGIQPKQVVFHVKADAANLASGYFVLGTGSENSNIAAFFYMKDDGSMGLYEDVGGWHSAPYVSGQWYKIKLAFDWNNQRIDYYVNDTLVSANVPFRGNVNNLTVLYLYNYHYARAWWDEITFSSESTPVCAVPPAGLVGWWPGEATAQDLTGNSDGFLENGTGFATGKVGAGFTFDGVNDRVLIPDAPALKPQHISIETWVAFNSLDTPGASASGLQYLVFKQNSRVFNFEGYALAKQRVAGQDRFVFEMTSADPINARADSATVISPGIFYHVVATYDGNFMRLYVNGSQETAVAHTRPIDYGILPVWLGTSGAAFDGRFSGMLDEVSLYDRALTAIEIAQLYAAGSAGKCLPETRPATILVPPQDQSALPGDAVEFSVVAIGIPPLSYQWSLNDAPIAGATSSSVTITNVNSADVGTYSVQVSNAWGSSLSPGVRLQLLESPIQFFSAAKIQIPAAGSSGVASAYPSLNQVAGVSGNLGRLEVVLNKIAHGSVADLDIALVSPQGQKVMLMSDAGRFVSATNLDLTFSDFASSPLPSASVIASATYLPTDYEPGEALPLPAPAPVYPTNLSVFNGTSPIGAWGLYVNDDANSDVGSLSGWSLVLYLAVPFNDQFVNRLSLAGPNTTTTDNNAHASKESQEANHAGNRGGRSVWWKWRCPTDGLVTVDTVGSSFDTLLAIYSGNSVTNLLLVASNDDAVNLQSRVSFYATPGQEYQIAVDGYEGAEGDILLNLAAGSPSPLVIFCPSDFTVNSFSDVPNPDPDSVFVQSSCGAVTRSFLGEAQFSSGCESFIDRTYRVVDSCQQTNTCIQRITVRSRPEIFNVSISEAVQSDGYHVTFCASVSGSNLSYEWTVDSQNTVTNLNNCFEAVFPTLDEATHTIGLIVRNLCGFDGTTTPPITTCSVCLSRGTPNLLTANSGGGFGPEITTAPCGPIGGGALWYKLVAYDAGNVTISTEGSPSDTLLTVFTGSLLFGQFNSITCNDNVSAANPQSRVNFTAEQGKIYWIAVDPRTSSPNIRLAIGYQPRIEMARFRADGAFELRSSVVPAIPFQVQAATTLSPGETDWSTVLVTNPSPAFPYVHYLEASNTNYPRRYFRLAPGP